jgi:hypothetical protein
MSAPRLVRCPQCRKQGDWFVAAWGPFCSRRCKLIDLGKWLGEEHVIPSPLKGEHFEDFAELPAGEHLDRPERE